MQLRHIAIVLGAATFLASLGIAGAGMFVASRYDDAVDRLETTGSAIRHLMTADMMHEGLRAVVYRVLHESGEQDSKGLREAVGELDEVEKTFQDSVANLLALPLDGTVKAEVAALAAPLKQYFASGREIVQSAQAGKAIDKQIEVFDSAFKALEIAMERVSENLDTLGQETAAATSFARSGAFYGGAFGALLAAAAALLLVLVVRRRVVRPLAALSAATLDISEGRLDAAVPYSERTDEMGMMAKSLLVLRDHAAERAQLAQAQAADQSHKQQRAEVVEQLIATFEAQADASLAAVGAAATQLDGAARTMAGVAEQARRQAATSSSAATETAASVSAVASAAQELAGSLGEVGRQVEASAAIAAKAVSEAGHTRGVVAEMAGAARKIGDVVELISSIAAQTNLLALNATIEAARAGDAGRGFAIVAQEVKALAAQTATATEDIAAQVGAIQQITGSAEHAIDGIGGTIGDINQITTAIAAAVEEQNSATGEIARSVTGVAEGTEQTSAAITAVSEAAALAETAGSQVVQAASGLGRESQILRDTVRSFLADIRAA